jgi:hypothetical protein
MAIKYYVCGPTIPRLSSGKIRKVCESIETFMSAGDDDTVSKIKNLCATIVDDIDAITRDRLKGGTLVLDVKDRALAFRPEATSEL